LGVICWTFEPYRSQANAPKSSIRVSSVSCAGNSDPGDLIGGERSTLSVSAERHHVVFVIADFVDQGGTR
jgi:hypothetical protein